NNPSPWVEAHKIPEESTKASVILLPGQGGRLEKFSTPREKEHNASKVETINPNSFRNAVNLIFIG
ncbi:hypothetical protein, partial [Akkermansia sp.]|uniref:hypothetical protein n=1 Tax=Akkermansia sp. TaxID=1872421 RepID=UPI003AB311EA